MTTDAITRSTFDVLNPEDGIVAVIDRDKGMSVTNDADNVVRALAHHGHLGSGDRLIYRDTMGQWDEILHRGGELVGFRPIRAKTMLDAIRNCGACTPSTSEQSTPTELDR